MKELFKFEFFKLRKNSIIMLIFFLLLIIFIPEMIFALMSLIQEDRELGIATTNDEIQELVVDSIFDNSRIVIPGMMGWSYQTAIILIVIDLSCVAVGLEYGKKQLNCYILDHIKE